MSALLLGDWKWNGTDRKYEMLVFWVFFPFPLQEWVSAEMFSQQECKSLLGKKIIANNNYFFSDLHVTVAVSNLVKKSHLVENGSCN